METNAASAITHKTGTHTPVVYVCAGDEHKKQLAEILEGASRLNVSVNEKSLGDANILLLLKEDEALLKQAWDNGIVAVTLPFSEMIEDYNPNTERGNSFVFNRVDKWEVFAALVRAVETYKFPYDWKFLVRSCKKTLKKLV